MSASAQCPENYYFMKTRYPRLIIAGTRGGSGKTTLSLGLIAAWREKGVTVVPYKKGPDYIDAGWLSAAAGHPCYNLDPFLMGRREIVSSFAGHFVCGGYALIEGNRGLYDGMDVKGTYSTAELSKILKSPIILVLDCTKTTRTAAAVVLGMQKFEKRIEIKGVVLNQVAGSRHERIVRESIERHCSLPVLGAIPKLKGGFLSERHMGLTPFQEHPGVKERITYAEEVVTKYCDIGRITSIAKNASLFSHEERRFTKPKVRRKLQSLRIGIIKDSAFQFYYPENFEELERRGAELIEISALEEKKLPHIDALYIGGGFPETHAIGLAKNRNFKKSVQAAIKAGLPVYAECGGLMYLGTSIILEGRTYPMAGIFPLVFSLEKKPQAHGYTIVKVERTNPFYPRGTVLKGHEFHYSRVLEHRLKKGMYYSFRMKRGQGIADRMDGICYKNTLATYTHLHSLGSPEWTGGFIEKVLMYKKRNL